MTRTTLVTAAVVALIVLAVTWAGRSAEGQKALVECDGAMARGDTTEAIFAARVAAEARCPGCGAPEAGFTRLETIAKDAEARGDDVIAFAAWRGAHAALLATASFSTGGDRRTHVEMEVARLAHRIDAAAMASGAPPTPAAAEDKLRASLAATDVPSGAAFALVGFGGIVFLIAAARFAARRTGRTDLGLAGAGMALAIAGLYF